MRYVYVNGMNAYLTAADFARNEGIPAARADRLKAPSPVPNTLKAVEWGNEPSETMLLADRADAWAKMRGMIGQRKTCAIYDVHVVPRGGAPVDRPFEFVAASPT